MTVLNQNSRALHYTTLVTLEYSSKSVDLANKLNSQFCGWYLEPRAKCQDQLSIAGLVTGSIWLPKNMSDQIDLATLDQ